MLCVCNHVHHRVLYPCGDVLSHSLPQLSVPLRDTLLRGTFNSSLKNPLSGDFMKKQGSVATKGKHAFVLEV